MATPSTILHLAAVIVFLVGLILERTAAPSECLALPALVLCQAAYVAPIGHALLGRIIAKSQALVSAILLFVLVPLLVAAFWGIFSNLTILLTRIFTLLAFPFGTLVYLALWGDFPRGSAARVLGGALTLWVVGGVLLALSNLDFLRHKTLVGFLLGLLLLVLVSVLHGWVPLLLVSITDALGALILDIVGVVWLLRTCISLGQSLLAILRAGKETAPQG